MTRPLVPLWADADEIDRRYMDPDPQRHDLPEPDPIWPEIVDDRCRICGQVVGDGLIECDLCFEIADTTARRREDR